jgi:molecular chaperone IbpA
MLNTFPFLGFDLDLISTARNHTSNYPFINIITDKNRSSYSIEVAVAGFKKENLEVTFENGNLVISGEHPAEAAELDKVYEIRNISKAKFTKSFVVARAFEPTDISLDNGILKVVLTATKKASSNKLPIK